MNRLVTAASLGAAVLLAPVAFAQTGMARGKVLDDKGQPLAGAKITWEFQGGVTRKGEVTTNKKGEFVQVGLQPGNYKFTVNVQGFQPQAADMRIGLGEPTVIPDFKMVSAAAAAAAAGGAPDPGLAALRAAVDQAITLQNSGKTDEALALYADLATQNPTVHQIPFNMALLYSQKKDWANAEAAYKKALEIKPDYTEATVGLSNLLVNTSRGGEAADVLGEALAANPADNKLLLQQGVLLYNTGKQAEAADVFKKIVAADTTSAEPYFYLGTIAVGQGNTAECIANLEKYLSLNPQNAQNVATAKGLIEALKK
jgi:tetratricopeptide (TPR) repeat protein